MSDSLTTIISKVQALLGDDGTIFTTATVTAAVRNALKTFNMHAPIHAAELIDAVSDQYAYELSDYDSRAMRITDILLQGNDEYDISLTYDEYNEDERLFFRLRSPQPAGEILIARFTIPHTVNELDSQTESTLPAWQDQILVVGSAAEACRIRARARVESNNLDKATSDNYREVAQELAREFIAELRSLSQNKHPAIGEPDKRRWTV